MRRVISTRIGLVAVVMVSGMVAEVVRADGRVYGIVRQPMIKGQPAAGYLDLYEFDVYLSPSSNAFMGEARRSGTTAYNGSTCYDKWPQGGGDYCYDGLPADTYSLMVNQPEFFTGHPKVVGDIVLGSTEARQVYLELPVDYSTRVNCCGGDPWTWPQTVWYQTYMAIGINVTGVVFRIADSIGGACDVSILESNANPNPLAWEQIGPTRRIDNAKALADNWVRWRSGEVPTTPGVQYAVMIAGVNRNLQPLRQLKGPLSYQGGQAYDASGTAQGFDLDYTVFADNDGTIMPVACRNPLKSFISWDPNNWATGWGQTFVATGTSLASVDFWETGDDCWEVFIEWRVRQGGPTGAQIGPTKTTKPAWWGPGVALEGVSYSKNEVPLTPGQTYFLEFRDAGGNGCTSPVFNVVATNDPYDYGYAYQWNGSSWNVRTGMDVTMTVVEYVGPIIKLNKTSLVRSVYKGQNPSCDTFTITNTGWDTLSYNVSDNAGWLSEAPPSGTAVKDEADPINVCYDVSGLDCGDYYATITVSGNAVNSPQTISVKVTVRTVGPDLDCDFDVDQEDFGLFQVCYTGPGIAPPAECEPADFEHDDDVDLGDLAKLVNCMSGADNVAPIGCDE